MDKLLKSRNKIDKIDKKIIKLYEKRMDVVYDVTSYKLENKMDILDSSREKIMLDKNCKKIKNRDLVKYYHFVLEGYLNASKTMQKDLIDKENKKEK